MRRFFNIFVAVLFFVPAVAFAAEPAWLTTNIREFRLANGLRLIVKEKHDAPLVGVSVWYDVGFLDEPAGKTHISHYLEHMMFKGTQDYPDTTIPKLLHENGAQANAYTSDKRTVYFEVLPAARLELALAIEASRMRRCTFTPEAMQREKGVIRSELLWRRDEPSQQLYKLLTEKGLGPQHPLNSYFGGLDGLASITRADLQAFYDRYYVPANSFIVVVGAVDAAQVRKLVEKHFAAFAPGTANRRPALTPFRENLGKTFTLNGAARESFSYFSFPAPAEDKTSDEYWAARFIADTGLAGVWYDSDAGFPVFSGSGREVPQYPAESLTPEMLKSAFGIKRKDYFANQEYGYRTVQSVMMALGGLESQGSWRDHEVKLAAYRRLTPESVLAVVRRYLTRANAVTAIFKAERISKRGESGTGSGKTEDHTGKVDYSELDNFTPAALAAERADNRRAAAATLDVFTRFFSALQVRELANGTKLVLFPQPDARTVSVRVTVRAGEAYQQLPRQAAITADHLFDGGPFIRLKNRINHEGGRMGGPRTGYEEVTWDFSVPAPLAGLVPEVLGLALTNRSFFPAVHTAALESALLAIRKRESGQERAPESHAFRNLMLAFFPPGSAIGRDLRAGKGEVTAFALAQAADFYRRMYTGKNITITIVGNFSLTGLPTRVAAALAALPAGVAAGRPPFRPQAPEREIRRHASLPEKQNSIVVLGTVQPDYPREAIIHLSLGNEILGGGTLTSRLGRNIRQKQGLSYGISAFSIPYSLQSLWGVYALSPNATLPRLIASTRAEIDKFMKDGPTEMEVQKAYRRRLVTFAFSLETPEKIAALLAGFYSEGRTIDALLRYFRMADKLDAASIHAAMKQYLPTDNLVISTAGGK